ncbi:hypothetical protein B9Z55_019005 [Caenorhabditis nigoni]|nr:hypothetical protein B9Z55_019005 [Caenorhabditis nigoni]
MFIECVRDDQVPHNIQNQYPMAKNTKIMLGNVWPERNTAFPDFLGTQNNTNVWWAGEFAQFHKTHAKIVFNAPYDDKHVYHIKVINSSARRIGYGIKTTNMKRLGVDPPCGVLDPKEAVLLAVSCDAFAYGQEDTNNDRITVEWTNTPDGAAKQFRREWFQGDGMVRRKNLPIEYNP